MILKLFDGTTKEESLDQGEESQRETSFGQENECNGQGETSFGQGEEGQGNECNGQGNEGTLNFGLKTH